MIKWAAPTPRTPRAVVVQQHVKAAVTLLDWLAAQELTLATAHQGDLET